MSSSHSTLSALISTQTITQFSEQNESFSQITSFEREGFTSGQTLVRGLYSDATTPVIDSRTFTKKFVEPPLTDTQTSFGQTQGSTGENSSGRSATNDTTNILTTTSPEAGHGTTATRIFNNSNTINFESGFNSSFTSSSSSTKGVRRERTDVNGRRGTDGGYNGRYSFDGTTIRSTSYERDSDGESRTTYLSFTSSNAGGATYSNTTTEGETDNTITTTRSEPFTNQAGAVTDGTTSFPPGSPHVPPAETMESTNYSLSTFSRTTRFTDTMTSSQFVFSNDDTTITNIKTTRSTGTFVVDLDPEEDPVTRTGFTTTQKDITRDTTTSERVTVDAPDPSIETVPFNVASTFTIYGNAGFVTAANTGTYDLKMTDMPQFVTSPGVLKPSNEEFTASLVGTDDNTYSFRQIRTSRDDSITNKTTRTTFESRSAAYSRQTNESYIADDGNLSYSSRLISQTTESYFQTTFVSEKTRGTKFYTTTFSSFGSAKDVNSIVQSTTEKITPVVFFDGSSFDTTENITTVYITTTGLTHKAFNISVFGGENITLFQTRGLPFFAPRDDEAKAFVTDATLRIHTAEETIFNGEKAFVQATDDSSQKLFAKQFPPILEFSETTTVGDTSAPETTTTSNTFITGLGSIRRFISLMFSDSTFSISGFRQNGSTGQAGNRNFTIADVGEDTDINHIEDERRIANEHGYEFVGGINNVTSSGYLTASNLGSFAIGDETHTLSSLETFMTTIDFSTMQKIQNSAIPFASHASRKVDNAFRNRILVSHLNRETRL